MSPSQETSTETNSLSEERSLGCLVGEADEDHQIWETQDDGWAMSCGMTIILDNNTSFSMIHKPADDKISYLKTLFKDPDYLKMVDALASSDKVFHFMKIVIK